MYLNISLLDAHTELELLNIGIKGQGYMGTDNEGSSL
jgi:hypothetical protein